MSAFDTVSVVIPTYNRSSVLSDAIDSVLAQQWSNIEVVVVDDGSTDGTAALLQRYSSTRGVRIRIIQGDRWGPAKARNAGIAASSGDFIAFLDSDDIWLMGKLKAQMALFDRSPSVDLVFTAYMVNDHLIRLEGAYGPGILDQLLDGCCIAVSTVVARRKTLPPSGPFDSSLSCCEDHDLWLRMAAQGAAIRYLPEPFARRRTSLDSLSNNHVRVAQSAEFVFERLFDEGVLPDRIQARRRSYLSRCYLNSACAYVEAGDGEHAMIALGRAARLRPASIRPGWLRMAIRCASLPPRREQKRSRS